MISLFHEQQWNLGKVVGGQGGNIYSGRISRKDFILSRGRIPGQVNDARVIGILGSAPEKLG